MTEELPPHAPIAIGTTIYGHGTLDWYRRTGVTHLRVWCVHCTHWNWLHLETLLTKVNAGVSLAQLARRSKCEACRRKGAHIEPSEPPSRGTHGYREWVQAERERCRAFLTATDADVACGPLDAPTSTSDENLEGQGDG
jgi:hypothetical protein